MGRRSRQHKALQVRKIAAKALLIESIKDDNIRGIKQALRSGASVEDTDREGNPLMFKVVETCSRDNIESIINTGPNSLLHLVNDKGNSLLMHAIIQHKDRAARKLLEYIDLDLNYNNPSENMTALMLAAKHQQKDVFEDLLIRGAATTASYADYSGKSVWHYARETGDVWYQEQLKAYDAICPDIRLLLSDHEVGGGSAAAAAGSVEPIATDYDATHAFCREVDGGSVYLLGGEEVFIPKEA